MLNPARAGAHRTAHLRDPSPEVVAGWSRAAGVALVTLAPELPGALAVIATLVERGVVVAAGHTDATAAELVAARDAGVTMTTHLFNAMRPFRYRDPGVIGAALAGVVPFAGLIVDGIHVHPVTVAAAWKALGPHGLVLVSDAVSALGLPAGPIRLGGATATSGPDGVRLADGTLAGSALSMDAAVRNLMAFTGCPLVEAVASASANPAAVLGDGSRGILAPGRRGDLVLVTGDGHVVATVIGGEVAWTR
jgi:N-acetylglucosamine-6-phosphate deacetylase